MLERRERDRFLFHRHRVGAELALPAKSESARGSSASFRVNANNTTHPQAADCVGHGRARLVIRRSVVLRRRRRR